MILIRFPATMTTKMKKSGWAERSKARMTRTMMRLLPTRSRNWISRFVPWSIFDQIQLLHSVWSLALNGYIKNLGIFHQKSPNQAHVISKTIAVCLFSPFKCFKFCHTYFLHYARHQRLEILKILGGLIQFGFMYFICVSFELYC